MISCSASYFLLFTFFTKKVKNNFPKIFKKKLFFHKEKCHKLSKMLGLKIATNK